VIELLLLAQVMVETLDERPQRAIPATAFRCNFARSGPDGTTSENFDLYGTIPLAPEGHKPNDYFPFAMGSSTGDPLAGNASANPLRSSDWFREYQITRGVGTASYVINLKLRREGQSVAHVTVYDDSWNAGREGSAFEPYRYYAVGLCGANFNPSEKGA
jgi:hypothetical protein